MKYDLNEIKKLPDLLNKEQIREVCHISKRTATFYLESGLLPYQHSGKKTRCYSVKKKDLIQFLERLQENPARYTAPKNWYKGTSCGDMFPQTSIYLTLNENKTNKLTRYYVDKLENHPDVLSSAMVSSLIGYAKRTIMIWCREGRIKSLVTNPKHLIPKVYLIEFLVSDSYNNILKKSEKHIQAILDFKNSRYDNELLSEYL